MSNSGIPHHLSQDEIYNLILEIEGDEGDGIGEIDGYKIIVNGADQGDIVSAQITNLTDNYGFARSIGTVDHTQPFFAYGIFQSGELGHTQIQNHVETTREAQLSGSLFIEDGLILLHPNSETESIYGNLIQFKSREHAEEAYRTITRSEPSTHYIWSTVELDEPEDQIVNVLIDRTLGPHEEPTVRRNKYQGQQWTGETDDTIFSIGLETIKTVFYEIEEKEEQQNPEALEPFFRYQMAYLLLWSAIERYISLKYGSAEREGTRRKRRKFSTEEEAAIQEALHCEECSINVRSPDYRPIAAADRKSSLRRPSADNPQWLVNYYYRIRNNVVHRGKGSIEDKQLIKRALVDLYNIFRCHILPQQYRGSPEHEDKIS